MNLFPSHDQNVIQRLREAETLKKQNKLNSFVDEILGFAGDFGGVLQQIQTAKKLFGNDLLKNNPGVSGALGKVLGLQLAGLADGKTPQSQFTTQIQAWRNAQLQVASKDNALKQAQLRLAKMLVSTVIPQNATHQAQVRALLERIANKEEGNIGP